MAVRLPPPVQPGDTIGVAAISGPVDPGRLANGLAALRGLGFNVVEASNLRASHRLYAGTDPERLDAFHALAARDDIGAILFARGGWGALRLLPAIDWELLGRRPRAYVGYSDLTPFLLQVVQRLGIAAFHGPMVAADLARGLDAPEQESFLGALAGRYPVELRPCDLRTAKDGTAGNTVPRRGTRGGDTVTGPLLGDCLSLLTATLGTPWQTDYRDSILFVEELHEPLYRLDRMLTHLRLSGSLNGVRGIVSGHLTCVGGAGEGERHGGEDSRLLLEELAGEIDAPYIGGLEAGHESPNLTLSLGLGARLDPRRGMLTCGLGSA
jgi:muramoyltetrapeptide carboxypeptidase